MPVRHLLRRACLVVVLTALTLSTFPASAAPVDQGTHGPSDSPSVLSLLQTLWSLLDLGDGLCTGSGASEVTVPGDEGQGSLPTREVTSDPANPFSTTEDGGEIGPDIDPNG